MSGRDFQEVDQITVLEAMPVTGSGVAVTIARSQIQPDSDAVPTAKVG